MVTVGGGIPQLFSLFTIFHLYRTDEDSFQKVKNWVKELKKMLGSEIVLTIVGNKLDLNKDRNVPVETAERWDLIPFLI